MNAATSLTRAFHLMWQVLCSRAWALNKGASTRLSPRSMWRNCQKHANCIFLSQSNGIWIKPFCVDWSACSGSGWLWQLQLFTLEQSNTPTDWTMTDPCSAAAWCMHLAAAWCMCSATQLCVDNLAASQQSQLIHNSEQRRQGLGLCESCHSAPWEEWGVGSPFKHHYKLHSSNKNESPSSSISSKICYCCDKIWQLRYTAHSWKPTTKSTRTVWFHSTARRTNLWPVGLTLSAHFGKYAHWANDRVELLKDIGFACVGWLQFGGLSRDSWRKVENSLHPIDRLQEPEWLLFCPKKTQCQRFGQMGLHSAHQQEEWPIEWMQHRKKLLNDISFECDGSVIVVQPLQKQLNCSLDLPWADESMLQLNWQELNFHLMQHCRCCALAPEHLTKTCRRDSALALDWCEGIDKNMPINYIFLPCSQSDGIWIKPFCVDDLVVAVDSCCTCGYLLLNNQTRQQTEQWTMHVYVPWCMCSAT